MHLLHSYQKSLILNKHTEKDWHDQLLVCNMLEHLIPSCPVMCVGVCVCSQLHPEGGESQLPAHPQKLPPEVSLCGKMDVLDRILVKLIAAGHKVGIPIYLSW